MRARKLLAVSLVLVAGVLGVAARGQGGSGAGSSGGKVTMTFWNNATTGDGKTFWEKNAADFQAARPNVTIKIQATQNEDLDGKLQTALNSGDAPDIFLQRGGDKMAAMVKAGQLMDITGSITDATKQVVSAGSFKAETLGGKVILNRESTFTLPLGVPAFASQYSVDTAKVLAFTSLSMIPALVFFSLFQRRIVGGLTGAVKG